MSGASMMNIQTSSTPAIAMDNPFSSVMVDDNV